MSALGAKKSVAERIERVLGRVIMHISNTELLIAPARREHEPHPSSESFVQTVPSLLDVRENDFRTH